MDGEAHQPKIDLEQISRRHPREVYRLVRRFVDDPEGLSTWLRRFPACLPAPR